MGSTKFVYFDVGGVSIIDFSGNNKWEEMKRAFGITKDNSEHFERVWETYEDRICIDCDVDTLIPEFRKVNGVVLSNEYSMLVDFVDRFERNESLWPIFEKTKEQYHIGLLTNMYPRMLDAIKGKALIPNLEWDSIVDSSVVGYQKPHPSIYQIAEEKSGVKPDEILFIDNSESNVQEAAKRGWKTFLYDPRELEKSTQELVRVLNLDI